MRHKLLLCFAIVVSLFPAIAHAVQPVSCEISPLELWVDKESGSWLSGDSISINCTCEGISASSALTGSSGTIAGITLENSSVYHTGTIYLEDPLSHGNYTVASYCTREQANESTNTSSSLKIRSLSSVLVSQAPSITYPEDVLDLKLEFKSDGQPILSGATFIVSLGGTSLPLQGAPSYSSGIWTIKAKVPASFNAYGRQDLSVSSSYNGYSVTTKAYDYTDIKPQIYLNIIDPPFYTPYRLTDMGDIKVRLEIHYRKDLIDKSLISGFKAELDNKEVKIEKIDYIDDEWILLINIPRRAPREKPYALDIYVDYNDQWTKSSRSIPVQFDISFVGSLLDAKDQPASGVDIKLQSADFEEKLKTDDSGRYSAFIPPGTYALEILLPDFQARLTGIDLHSDNNLELIPRLIQYDYISSSDFAAKKTAFLKLALPFKDMLLKIPYSDSEFTDEDNILVFRCMDWNFRNAECPGDWIEADASIDTNRNIISIYASSPSAFQILEKKGIRLDISLDKDRYYLGEKITLTGKLLDENMNALSDATIIYTAGSISGEVRTGSDGYFSASFTAPEKEGAFSLAIEAKKDAYSVKKSIPLTAYKKMSLAISSPSSVNIEFDTSTDISFTVSNSGQEPLEDISLEVSGIPDDWYHLGTSHIDHLDISGKQDIALNLLLSGDICSKDTCKDRYAITLEAGNGLVSASSLIGLRMADAVDEESVKDKTSSQDEGIKNDSHVTGNSTIIISPQGLMILLMPLILIILLSRRKDKIPALSRASFDRSISEVKEEVLKTGNSDIDSSIRSALKRGASGSPHSQKRTGLSGIIKDPFSKDS